MVRAKPRVSNMGRYRNSSGVVYTPSLQPNGYRVVFFGKKHLLLHRLIAKAFHLPRQPDQIEIDHIDGDSSNNRLSNLRWVTHKANMRHQVDLSKRKSNAPKRSKPVMGRKLGEEEWTTYSSACDAARALNVSQGNVSACCAGRYTNTGGFEFKFAPASEPPLLEDEEWRLVPGTSGAAVSSLGRFRNAKGLVTRPSSMKDGYVQVGFDRKTHRLHRVIAEVFDLPRLPGQTMVNHKDLNPCNNALSNLEWASPEENSRHYFALASPHEKRGRAQEEPLMLDGEEWVDVEVGEQNTQE